MRPAHRPRVPRKTEENAMVQSVAPDDSTAHANWNVRALRSSRTYVGRAFIGGNRGTRRQQELRSHRGRPRSESEGGARHALRLPGAQRLGEVDDDQAA